MSEQQISGSLILHNGRFTTIDRTNPAAEAVLIRDGRFVAVGSEADIMRMADTVDRSIDLGRRRVVPGLIDSHIHMIRGGLTYNLELRWDGIGSLADAMNMLRLQAANTPPPHWVRVIGGYCESQFQERRLPTLEELNAAAPETPVMITHLYDRALLNAAALRACGYDRNTPDPPRARFARDGSGTPTGLIVSEPDPWILYNTMAKAPKLPPEHQRNSTLTFMRELNRLGVTGINDAGGGFFNYPQDFEIAKDIALKGEATVRMAYNLLPQVPGSEFDSFSDWVKALAPRSGDATYRHNGAGEMLVYSAGDWEDFRQARPELPVSMEAELETVTRLLAEYRWPFRMHATYDETIGRALDVFEKVDKDVPLKDLHWFFDHAETVSARNIDRIAKLGGGIAIQHRMAYQGEYFVERYGADKASHSPPIGRMLANGLPVGAGTDATRVSSHNPWISMYWLVTGKTVGGLRLYMPDNRVDRETALGLWTRANTWFSSEEGIKGQIAVGQLADLAVLSQDYLAVAEEDIPDTRSVMTVLGGRIVHGDEEFKRLAPPAPKPAPDWSPVARFGGVHARAIRPLQSNRVAHGHFCSEPTHSHGYGHVLGRCTCWAF